jgi:hypothetical protein
MNTTPYVYIILEFVLSLNQSEVDDNNIFWEEADPSHVVSSMKAHPLGRWCLAILWDSNTVGSTLSPLDVLFPRKKTIGVQQMKDLHNAKYK